MIIFVQLVAMVSMVVDHVGVVFYPGEMCWRIVGRLAFPIYAVLVGIGLAKTRDVSLYARRLVLLALFCTSASWFMVGS